MPFVIYKSSAGSGKTYTLVKEYLKLALCDEDKFRRILAITFTNKAAEEMKSRILGALSSIAARKEDDETRRFIAELQNATGFSDDRISLSSKRVLYHILHNYSDFAVCTIDSFVHNIVRAFARDLRLSWNFEVETEEEQRLSETVDRLMSSIGIDQALTRSLIEFAESQTDDQKDWNIERPLKELSRSLLNDDSIEHLVRLKDLNLGHFELIIKQLTSYTHQFKSEINGMAQMALKIIKDNGLSEEEFYKKGQGIVGYYRKLESEFEIDHLFPNQTVLDTITNNRWFKKETPSSIQRKIQLIQPRLSEYFNDIQQIIAAKLSNYALSRLILKKIHALAILTRITELLDQLKLEKNFILISEFNKRVHEVVAQETVPFIFERIGEKYEHYLIDEFQDTSLLQWSNLLPLVDNSLASNLFNMVAGDGKQAIYRFRNGDVEQFAHLPKIFKAGDDPVLLEREASLVRHKDIRSLRTNYRSAKNIVEFNNEFFSFLSGFPELKNKTIYEELQQENSPDKSGGYIKIEFVDQDEENEFNQNVLDKTLKVTTELVRQGFLKKDIAILTRHNNDASAIASHLIRNGIPVVSAESVLIYRSPEVRFIIAVLRYLADPSNSIAKAEILVYLHQQQRSTAPAHHVFTDATGMNRFFENMRSLGYKAYLKDLQFLSLYEIAETIISNFLPDRSPDIFLHHFLDVVLAYTLREGNSPDQFLIWWDENKQKYSVVLPQGIDAVQVMTIHKAKGLEFPIVLLPKASWKIKTGKDGMWISPNLPYEPDLCSAMVRPHKDLLQTDFAELYNEEIEKSFLDNLNLLYVALTRAEQRLYIFCSEVNKTPTGNAAVNSLFIHFLEFKSLWDLNKKCYEFGEPETPKDKDNKKKRTPADYTLQSVSSSSWRNRLRIKRTHRDTSQQADWGTVVHAALAKIITLNDIHDAVEELAITGLIERDQSLTLEQSLTGLLHQDDVKRFFEPGLVVKTEGEMILADHTIRRIDRVILADKHAIVIDYKTGHSNNDEYRQRLELYAEAVQQMGYIFVEKYLLYTDENKLVKI